MQTSNIMEDEDVSPNASLQRNGSFICVAAPFLYDKLPEEPLKLSILKLDGSSFGNYTYISIFYSILFMCIQIFVS